MAAASVELTSLLGCSSSSAEPIFIDFFFVELGFWRPSPPRLWSGSLFDLLRLRFLLGR